MMQNMIAKKVIKDLIKTLNKYDMNYRLNIKDINIKNNKLFNKNIVISMNVKQIINNYIYNRKMNII